jgi:hypothetical protein
VEGRYSRRKQKSGPAKWVAISWNFLRPGEDWYSAVCTEKKEWPVTGTIEKYKNNRSKVQDVCLFNRTGSRNKFQHSQRRKYLGLKKGHDMF